MPRFEWDAAKNEANIEKHGFDFADAAEIFAGRMLVAEDRRQDYGETRFIGVGLLRFAVVVVVFVEKTGDTIRIISMREALPHEKRHYHARISD